MGMPISSSIIFYYFQIKSKKRFCLTKFFVSKSVFVSVCLSDCPSVHLFDFCLSFWLFRLTVTLACQVCISVFFHCQCLKTAQSRVFNKLLALLFENFRFSKIKIKYFSFDHRPWCFILFCFLMFEKLFFVFLMPQITNSENFQNKLLFTLHWTRNTSLGTKPLQ